MKKINTHYNSKLLSLALSSSILMGFGFTGCIDKQEKTATETRTGVIVSNIDKYMRKEIPGAHLMIQKAEGEKIFDWISTEDSKYFEIESGWYQLVQIDPSSKYRKVPEKILFRVRKDNVTTVTMENDQGKHVVYISNIDRDTKSEIEGLVLEILDVNGKEIMQLISKNEPRFIELDAGRYALLATDLLGEYQTKNHQTVFDVQENRKITYVEVQYDQIKKNQNSQKVKTKQEKR